MNTEPSRWAAELAPLWEKWDMLPAGARVLCAVSGGADSICLLHLLKSLEEERGVRVFAAHYEHGLRGEESLRDAAFVGERCRSLGVPLALEHGDVRAYAAERRLGLEEAARDLRYAFLERAADGFGCSRIATAHNADDNAETLLLNLIRGSGGRGLSGIPPRRGRIVRPLLEKSRAEIEAYLAALGLSHVEDASNADPAFRRNYLRREIMPRLRALNGDLSGTLGRTAELLRRDDDCLCGLADEWIEKHFDGESLPLGALRDADPAVAARVLRALCPGSPGAAHIEAALRFAEGTELGFLDLPGIRLRRERGRLYFGEGPPVVFEERRVAPEGVTELPELGLRLRAEPILFDGKEINSQFKTFCLAYERIKGEFVCGGRRPGDRMRPAGRGLGKSLKSLFLEAGMSQSERDRTLVFRDGCGILAAWPLALDERAIPAPGERAVRITVEKLE